jgi:peroxiredoxin
MGHTVASRIKAGIMEGQPAPDFELIDVHDNSLKLSSFKGKKSVVLVMNRSFVCPFCRRHMAQLRHDYPEFVKRGAEVVILGPNDRDGFKRIWQMEELQMVGLADPESKVANMYQQEVNLLKFGRLPALVVIDKQGIMRLVHHSKSMRDIPDNITLFKILDEINITPE